jgi:hypothetical protein
MAARSFSLMPMVMEGAGFPAGLAEVLAMVFPF